MASFIQQQNEVRDDYQDENTYKRRFSWRYIFFNTSIQGWIFIVAFAIIVPVLTYYVVVDRGSYKVVDTYTCYVNTTFRVPCGKVNITENDCVNVGCCYDKPSQNCYHYLPSRYSYDLHQGTYRVSRSKSPFSTTNLKSLKISVNEINADEVRIYLHQENHVLPNGTIEDNEKNYVVNKVKEKLMVEITRPNGDLLLSTAKGPLIASEKYWEWTMYLTNHSLFGFNQTLISLDENSTFSKVFYYNKNDQSSMPVFWAYRNGKFHGVSVNHNGPLEITVLPSNMVVLKSLSGDFIEIVLSVGPTPKLLHDQQRQVDAVDLPYWVMGTHICRKQEKYYNMTYLIGQVQNLDSEADSFCIDENLFMYLLRDSADNNNEGQVLSEFLSTYAQGKKFLLSLPPQVLPNSTLYNAAEDYDLLYKFKENIYVGKYLGQDVVYPDYSSSNNQLYLDEVDQFLTNYINFTIDGLVLTDNWPVNEEFKMDNVSFPYFNQDLQDAMSYTIQWNTTSNNTQHILKHNSYGASQYDAIKKYYESKNESKVIMSATKSFTQIEPTIVQNIDVSWENLRNHLVNVLFNSIAGNHLVSLPVCGDTSSYDPTLQELLCLRWYIIAATMPLFRITSVQPWRNPDDLDTVYAQQMAREFVEKRKMLLPYYYAILKQNEPVIRPMFYDYYENTITFAMEKQYMIGEKILVAHPLTSERNKLRIYLPPRIGVWYELWGGEMYRTNKTKAYIDLDITATDFIAFVAQGSIVPLVKDKEINIIVALNSTNNTAEGCIQIEDLTIDFLATDQTLVFSATYTVDYTLGFIKVYSYDNTTSYLENYRKNINLNETTSIIYYVDPTTTEPTKTETPTSTTSLEPTTENPAFITTDKPISTETPASITTVEPTTEAPASITTGEPTTTETSASITTVEPTTTEAPASITTGEPTTTETPASITTVEPTTTEAPASITTSEPTTTETPASITTVEPTTEAPASITTGKPTTTETPASITTVESTTEAPTSRTTDKPATTERPTSITTLEPTTEAPASITTGKPTTTETPASITTVEHTTETPALVTTTTTAPPSITTVVPTTQAATSLTTV